ncbi:MAG: lipoyl(octanoyl) transferase LipB [Burkholderiales bacterium]|nr:lipoyl(octanoyl) transferase LipB [Burkholderiales bacterium]
MADLANDAPAVVVRRLGRTDYRETWAAMRAFTDARDDATADEIWLTEHPPVYTLGLAGRGEHVLRANGIETIKVDRGGQVTYHGPGQLVAYVLLDLRRAHLGVRQVVRALEAAVIAWLATCGVAAYGKTQAPGVYVHGSAEAPPGSLGEAKIAALGLKVRRHCTYHGLAVNVAMDLAPFADIDPCGYPGLAVTDLARLGVERTTAQAGDELAPDLVRTLTEREGGCRARLGLGAAPERTHPGC